MSQHASYSDSSRLLPHPLLFASALAALAAVVMLTPRSTPAAEASFRVVANTDAKGAAISRKVLAGVYRGEAVRWTNGISMRPVDQSARSTIREAFTREVLGQSIQEQQSFWLKQISAGRRNPPLVKVTDEEVLAFLVANPGAVSYVSETASIPAGLKTLALVD